MTDYSSASIQYRSCIRRAIHLLHTLRSPLLNQAGGGEVEESSQGPRRTRIGGLAWYIFSDQGVNRLISSVAGVVRKAPMKELLQVLEEIQSSTWASDKTFQDSLTLNLSRVQSEVQEEQEDEPNGGDVIMTEEESFEVKQRRISREEHCHTVRRNVADWLRGVLE